MNNKRCANIELPRLDDETFRIGFAGTMNAPDAFAALLRALDQAEWVIAGRRVLLRVMGPRIDVRSRGPARVEFFGWRSLDETVHLLSETDVTYLPQPFAESGRHLATLSFPTKFTTYLAAGRPVLLHAPAYGSLVHYFREKAVGFWCDTLDQEEIVRTLTRIVTDREAYVKAMRNGRTALQQDFSQELFRANFARFLNLPVSSLKPVSAQDEGLV